MLSSQNGSSNTSTNREFVEGWTLAQTLGEGAYGEVKLLINRQTAEAVAMKMVDLIKHPDAVLSVRKEVCIQKILQDKHVLRYFGKRSQGNIEYIFLEYAAGGELFDRIEPDIGMPQHEAQRYFNQLLSGVKYLHTRGVAHRDLKPENLLLDEHDNIKISDFGMATMFRMRGKERLLDKRCGTLPYVAPEVLCKSYHAQPADVWSCGIILVTMLAGELPWDQPSISCQDFLNWRDNDKWNTMTPWKKIDTLAISLFRKVLNVNPPNRMKLDAIIEHKWCQTQFVDSELKSHDTSIFLPKRKRSNNDVLSTFEDSMSRNYCSQPMPTVKAEFANMFNMSCNEKSTNVINNENSPTLEARISFCFSQPALLDDLILCSQMNQTQTASQNSFQKLVRRMTRFFVTTKWNDSVKKLLYALDMLRYTWKFNDNATITISTVDRRKLRLVFKAYIIEMDSKILFDFRLSKGCGLEFKRRFIRIKQALEGIVLRGPTTWPIAIATNTVP